MHIQLQTCRSNRLIFLFVLYLNFYGTRNNMKVDIIYYYDSRGKRDCETTTIIPLVILINMYESRLNLCI